MENHEIIVRIAHIDDGHYAEQITEEMSSSAKARGTGIAKRSPEYVRRKMEEGKAVIALTPSGEWVGFCYIEAWSHGEFVANSGLVVNPVFRGSGVATRIKQKIFDLSRIKYPDSKIFGLTTGLAVMKINSELGYKPVTYSELTEDEEFWKGCQSCVNYDILMSKGRKNCLCTGMLFDPAWEKEKPADTDNSKDSGSGDELDAQRSASEAGNATASAAGSTDSSDAAPGDAGMHPGGRRRKRIREFRPHLKLYERWLRFKKYSLLKGRKEDNGFQGGTGMGHKKRFFSLFNLF